MVVFQLEKGYQLGLRTVQLVVSVAASKLHQHLCDALAAQQKQQKKARAAADVKSAAGTANSSSENVAAQEG